ncbi:uncharacterized protein LOC129729472 [Wyeomyia smithii]|uniref:uncharacterized protein LOC129729472 n=1 Tax=Wyeomyia smithii TaxID=174621 RepID=UPI002467C078|nr:uncharacterized protein LOC129729472 [Wyeomyia smithii]
MASIVTSGSHPTANCFVVLDRQGDCRLVVGDMTVHDAITAEWIESHLGAIQNSSLVVMDSNVGRAAMKSICELCVRYDKPVLFEPTDMRIASRPFQLSPDNFKVIRFITPNLYELRDIAKSLSYTGTISTAQVENVNDPRKLLAEVHQLASFINRYVDNVIVTLGSHGVAILRRNLQEQPFFDQRGDYLKPLPVGSDERTAQLRFYQGRPKQHIVNVSGAGDSFSSGFIAAMLDGQPEPVCVNVGFEAACCALGSKGAVAERYFDREHSCWQTTNGADFITFQ